MLVRKSRQGLLEGCRLIGVRRRRSPCASSSAQNILRRRARVLDLRFMESSAHAAASLPMVHDFDHSSSLKPRYERETPTRTLPMDMELPQPVVHRTVSEVSEVSDILKVSEVSEVSSEFLEVSEASSEFLEVSEASLEFSKVSEVSSEFLEVSELSSEFLGVSEVSLDFSKVSELSSEFLGVSEVSEASSEEGVKLFGEEALPLYETLRAWLLVKTQEEVELKARAAQALALRQEARVLFEEHEVEAFELCSDAQVVSGSLKQVVSEWFTPFSRAIRQKQKEVGRRSPSVLTLLPADILAVATIQTVLHMLKAYSQGNGLGLTTLTEQIGLAVQKEADTLKEDYHRDIWRALKSHASSGESFMDFGEEFANPDDSLRSRFDKVKRDKRSAIENGAILLQLLLEKARIPVQGDKGGARLVPAFTHTQVVKPPTTRGVIVPHPALLDKLMGKPTETVSFALNAMVCPPRPWTTPFDGGFLKRRNPIIRYYGEQKKGLNALKAADITPVLDGLNSLGAVPWKINTKVFEQMCRVMDSDLGLGDIVAKQAPKVDMPRRPKASSVEEKLSRDFRKEVDEQRRQVMEIKRDAQIHTSKLFDCSVKRQKAEELLGYDNFWFPYSLDFRGRAYPLPPHFNHIGNDLSRGLLLFGEGKPLGQNGLFWLRVHLANKFGFDKASFEERAQWAIEHEELILDNAQHPIDLENPRNGKWWTTADSPWQALACILELADALQSGNPEEFVSHLPIHQDGSCNGLQHYAALGRDAHGGEQVNLTSSSRPQDVYSTVKDRVQEIVDGFAADYDAEEYEERIHEATGEEKSRLHNAYCAHLLKDKINRKVVKQTVMTSVYGVTFVGARDQIRRRLEELNDANKALREQGVETPDIFDQKQLSDCSKFLATHTLTAIGDTFKSARDIKEWLKVCAGVMCKAGEPVAWITPLGLPVLQPYRKKVKTQFRTCMQHVVVAESNDTSEVHSLKQKTAFPPNFVHSLDSSHLLLTATACAKEGLAFAAVHDSYWTHPSDVDRMNRILREQFVELHKQDILYELKRQICARFPQYAHLVPDPPVIGDLNVSLVCNADYFFN